MAKTFPSNAPKPRPGSQRPRLPKVFWPANDNIPYTVKSPLLRRGFVKIGGRVIARAIPYVGLAITAYELYELWQGMPASTRPHARWTLVCTGPGTFTGNPYGPYWNAFLRGCTSNVNQFTISYRPDGQAQPADQHMRYGMTSLPDGGGTAKGLSTYQQWSRQTSVNSDVLWRTPVVIPNWQYPNPILPKPGPEELPIYLPSPYPNAPGIYQRPQPGEQPSNKPVPVTDFVAPLMPFPAYVTSPQEIYPYVPIQEIVIKPGGGGGGPPNRPRRPVPGPGVTTPPATGTKPPKPQPQTATEVSINYRNPTRDDLKDRPPEPNEVERKVRKRSVGRSWAFVGKITEGMDLVEVLYDAIPEGKCGKYDWKTRKGDKFTDPYEKAKAIYNCFEHINVGKALENYINNQIEDWMYALQGKALGKASAKLGVTTGLSRAITQNQEDDFVGYLVPKVDIDWSSGNISVTVKAINGKPKE